MKKSVLTGFRMTATALSLAVVLALMFAGASHSVQAGNVCPLPTQCSQVLGFCNNEVCGSQYFQTYNQCVSTLQGELCGGGNACSKDGRTNTNCSAPEILYCSDGMANFYKFVEDQGIADFRVSLATLQQSVSVKTLVMQVGQVKVYLLPDGTAELLAPQTDGKIYFMIFDPSNCASIQEGAEWNLQ